MFKKYFIFSLGSTPRKLSVALAGFGRGQYHHLPTGLGASEEAAGGVQAVLGVGHQGLAPSISFRSTGFLGLMKIDFGAFSSFSARLC